jgi:hypothetical protein
MICADTSTQNKIGEYTHQPSKWYEEFAIGSTGSSPEQTSQFIKFNDVLIARNIASVKFCELH